MKGSFGLICSASLQDFWVRVARYIDTPQVWRSFALTCRAFASIAQTFDEAKRNQFAVSIDTWIERQLEKRKKSAAYVFKHSFSTVSIHYMRHVNIHVLPDGNAMADFKLKDTGCM